ncbi:MAG TPA: ethanolamine permease [Kofleriaceae bacterium]
MSGLQRTLGPLAIWGLGVGYVISGMYFGWNYGLPEGGPYGLLAATGAATVLYIAFVLGYAELSCALPKAGGVFVYAGRAFGTQIGFVAGIAQLVEYVLAPVGIAFAIGSYINQAAPGVPVMAVAIVSYAIFTTVNIVGVRLSAGFELILTIVAVIELCVFGVVVLPHFSWARFSADPLPHGWLGVLPAMPFAIWFYLGIEGLANVAEEARAPQRDLPRGFFAAMVTLVVLTAIVLFGAVGAAGWRGIAYTAVDSTTNSDSPLPQAISHVVSRTSPFFVALTGIGLVGLVASFHGILIAASRSILALGEAGLLPRALGEIHPRRKTPVVALLANLVVGLIALATGRTDEIIVLSVLGALTLYVIAAASLIALRKREPELARPYRTPLYPAAPIVAIGLALICMGAMAERHPYLALIYAGILGLSWGALRIFVSPERRHSARFG